MKRNVIGVLVGMAVATAIAAAQSQTTPQQPPQSGQDQQKQDMTLTGCVIQGSTPSVFILENARVDSKDKTDKGKNYVLVATTEDLNLQRQLNHEVTVTGWSDKVAAAAAAGASTSAMGQAGQTGQAGQKINEKDLPKFNARTVTTVANTCSNLTR
jgi:ribosomal protein L12E/L44/L45/RPP1/RPP2